MGETRRVGRRRAAALGLVLVTATIAACAPSTGGPGTTEVTGTIAIQGGVAAVNRLDVSLDLTMSAGATEMRVANGSDVSASSWQLVSSPLPWVLTIGADGARAVSVQFRAGSVTSAVVTDTIIVDRVAPTVAITSAADGATVDLTDGKLFTLSGPVSDDRSGVAGVTVAAGGMSASAGLLGATWALPVSAPTSGPSTYLTTATDLAGNTAAVSIGLVMVLPAPDQTIMRPDVLTVEGPLGGALVDDGSGGDRLVFAGDRRAALNGAGVVVSGPLAASPEGLLRRVLAVGYDVAADRTTVTTELGELADVYAQIDIDTVLPARGGLRANANAGAATDCATFADNRTIGHQFTLPELGGSFPIPPLGPSHFSAGVSTTASLAVYFDLQLKISWGWFGPNVKKFKVEAGVLVCGEFRASAEVTADQLLGPQFEVGLPQSDAEAELGFKNPGGLDVGWSRSTNLLETFLPLIPCANVDQSKCARGFIIGTGPLYWSPTVNLVPIFDGTTSAELSMGGRFAVGARFGIDGTSPFFDPIGDASFTTAQAAAHAELSAGGGVAVGIKLGETILNAASGSAALGTVGIAVKAAVDPKWEGSLVGRHSWIASIQASVCPELQATLGLDLGVAVKTPWGSFTLSILSVEAAEMNIPLGECFYDHTWQYDANGALAITTASLPNGNVSSPYGATLAASDPAATWTITAGALPAGLSMSSDGAINGTPSATGTTTFTVQARDAFRRTASHDFTIVIRPPSGSFASWDAATDVLPTQVCPAWQQIGAGGTLTGGALRFSSSSNTDTNAYLQSGAALSVPALWVIDANLKLNSSSASSPARTSTGISFVTAPGVGNSLQFGNGEVFLSSGNLTRGPSASVDTSVFHTYRIAVDTSTGAIVVLMDGAQILTGSTFSSAEFNGTEARVEWGDGSILASGSSDWRSVSHNAATC